MKALYRWAKVLPEERRYAQAAFFTLGSLVASHAVLETARDALFLASIPAAKLPWVYILMAIASIAVGQLGTRIQGGSGRILTLTVGAAALVTFALGWFLERMGNAGLYVLYVWTGVLTAVVLMRFWVLLGGLFTVTQAKRLYGVIGTGSVLGAITGSGLARLMTSSFAPEALLYVGAGGLALTTGVTLMFGDAEGETSGGDERDSMVECIRYIAENKYARWLSLMTLLAMMSLTTGDYIFKSLAADRVPQEDLGSFFATVYLGLNIGSLFVQVVLVGWIVRRFNLSGALSVLPTLIWTGGIALVLMPGPALLAIALSIKGVDGVLRHTLNRTATELLYVPLSSIGRRRLKLFAEIGAQKGGQALASVGLLGLAAIGRSEWVLFMLAILATGWLLATLGLRRPYLAMVRGQIGGTGSIRSERLPELDLASLETLVATLDSRSDDEVVAAMELLERDGKPNLIPSLILHHPSEPVVRAALEIFVRTGRNQAVRVVRRVSDRGSGVLRAEALMALHGLGDSVNFERVLRDTTEPAVRATALAALVSEQKATDEQEWALLEAASSADVDVLLALEGALRVFDATHLDMIVETLLQSDHADVRRGVLRAIHAGGFPERRRYLLAALGDERTRRLARELLADLGEDGVELVRDALEDRLLPSSLRCHLPKTAARFEPQVAADLLQTTLQTEEDGLVRYWLIRALDEVVARTPNVRVNQSILDDVIRDTVSRAYRYLGRRVILSEQANVVDETKGNRLLVRILRDKERQSVGRVFYLLNITRQGEDFAGIWRSLKGDTADARSAGLELVDNELPEPLRTAMRGLVDTMPDRERLELGESYFPFKERSYADVLEEMRGSASESVRELVEYHLGEISLAVSSAPEPTRKPAAMEVDHAS